MIASTQRNATEVVAAGAAIGLLLGAAVSWIAVDVFSPALPNRPAAGAFARPQPGMHPGLRHRFHFGQHGPMFPGNPNARSFPLNPAAPPPPPGQAPAGPGQ